MIKLLKSRTSTYCFIYIKHNARRILSKVGGYVTKMGFEFYP